MNSITGKTKHSGRIILYIMVNGVKIFNRDKIANHFRDFYLKLGSYLAKNIQQGTHSIDHYILKIPRITKILVTSSTNFKEIEKIIDSLPSKTSSWHDGISILMLKSLSKSISYPLSIIFNQSLSSGSFPEKNENCRGSTPL